jgi:hypothetical protein
MYIRYIRNNKLYNILCEFQFTFFIIFYQLKSILNSRNGKIF